MAQIGHVPTGCLVERMGWNLPFSSFLYYDDNRSRQGTKMADDDANDDQR